MKDSSKDDLITCTDESPVTGPADESVSDEKADETLALMAKAISHPTRVRILRILSKLDARVCSQIVDEFPLAQSTVSEHLRILKEAGLISGRVDGPRMLYCISRAALRRLKALMNAL
ncbi:MAG: ArsR/SmtB family transcription factor [Acidobacteriota bacterium]